MATELTTMVSPSPHQQKTTQAASLGRQEEQEQEERFADRVLLLTDTETQTHQALCGDGSHELWCMEEQISFYTSFFSSLLAAAANSHWCCPASHRSDRQELAEWTGIAVVVVVGQVLESVGP